MSISDKLFEKYNRKAAEIGYRTDLYISDIRKHSISTASMLLTYNPNIGELSGEDIGNYFRRHYNCKVSPILATAKSHKPGVLSVIAEVVTKKRPYHDSQKMMAVGSAAFIDTSLDETYTVKKTNNGTKYLAKVSQDDIASIIAERNKRMAVSASSNITFDEVTAGVAIVDKGDKVKVFYDDKILIGTITDVIGSKVNIKTDGMGKITTEKTAILEMLKKSPAAVKKYKDSEIEFYTKMYGDEKFAKELVGK